MKMKEKLRMSMCVRIQKLAKKSPQVAQNLSINILAHLQQNALSTQVSDDQLVALVRQWSHQASQTDGEKPSSKHGATGIDDSHQTEKPRSRKLEAQIAAKQLRQHERSVEDEKYFEESMKNLQRLNEIEEEKERRRIERAKEQNVIQEEQRQFKLKKKQEELNARR
ncbi:hypothetical protein DYB32_001720 [Aphanomyces invadans]|uniref:Uncharacterized protein n=1 Tax=Aphanomyces invadans TaxID=157072 RepID=A0A418B5B4_9STRA|nr:hypothetical protein DYB32_001720 [Aphanomyces invadans]